MKNFEFLCILYDSFSQMKQQNTPEHSQKSQNPEIITQFKKNKPFYMALLL